MEKKTVHVKDVRFSSDFFSTGSFQIKIRNLYVMRADYSIPGIRTFWGFPSLTEKTYFDYP